VSTILTNTQSVRKELVARSMNTPSPWLAPTHSPMIAPTTLYVMPILIPVKIAGSAPGSRILKKTSLREAPIVRSRAICSGSAARSPSAVLTTMGKKQTRPTTMTLGRMV